MLGPFFVHGADEEGLFQEDLKIRSGGFLAFNHFQSPLLESPNLSLQQLIRNKIHGNGMGYTYTTPQSIKTYNIWYCQFQDRMIHSRHHLKSQSSCFLGGTFSKQVLQKKWLGIWDLVGFHKIPEDSIGFKRIPQDLHRIPMPSSKGVIFISLGLEGSVACHEKFFFVHVTCRSPTSHF